MGSTRAVLWAGVRSGWDAALLVGHCQVSSSMQQMCKLNWERQEGSLSPRTPLSSQATVVVGDTMTLK